MRPAGALDCDRGGRDHYVLLRHWRSLGGCGHRFFASFHPDAILHGAAHHCVDARGWHRWFCAFTSSRDENRPCLRGVRLGVHPELDRYGVVWLQHQRNGATVFQRGQRALRAQGLTALRRSVCGGRISLVHSADGDAHHLS